MPDPFDLIAASTLPRRLPTIELHDRSPTHGLTWAEAALAGGLATAALVGLVLLIWFGLRAHRLQRHPHEAAVMRLSRAARLSPAERRLVEIAAQRSRVDRLAILVAPSAFDRATALANLPLAECKPLRARLFGGRTR
jgi:hypothetical protein